MLAEGVYAIAAVLLVASGGIKLHDPEPTRRALAAARLPSGRAVVVVLALAELAAGSGALVLDHPVVRASVAVLYLGFAGFVAYALAAGVPLRTCGCFGRADTPPTRIHLAFDLALAGSAALGPRPLVDVVLTDGGPVYAGYVAVGTFLTGLILTRLPETLAAMRGRAP